MTLMLIVLLATGGLGVVQAQARTKPTVDRPIIYDYRVPDNLEEFMERADAVVIAKVTGSKDVSQPGHPRTDYDVDLFRVLKEHKNLQADSKVCRTIGAIEYPDRIVRRFQPNFPAFTVGTEYLLFLTWEESDGCFSAAFGPSGVGVLDEASGFKPLVPHPVLTQLRGLAEGSIEARVRALPKRP